MLETGTHITFDLPGDLVASEPPEARGLTRDGVRLLVASATGIEHARFGHLISFLSPGDLLVVNTSATLAAAVDGTRRGRHLVVHFSTRLDDGNWVAEFRSGDGSTPMFDATPGDRIELRHGATLEVIEPYRDDPRSRLAVVRAEMCEPVEDLLRHEGRPITYGTLQRRWPVAMYQTVFATHPGSAEMPSAGRPFSDAMVTRAITHGIRLAPITLHAGVSSQENGEPPLPERMHVPDTTATLVNHTRQSGGRVIAVGTTVTRALESAADNGGSLEGRSGWTDLVLGPGNPARVVDGLITGWHPPRASHLMLLEAVAGTDRVQLAYESAVAAGYLWHEFGDSCLLLAGD